jgi:hypothetical protein
VRTIDGADDSLYCEFVDDERFVELYNHSSDPYQLTNLWKKAQPITLGRLRARLEAFRECKGVGCRDI